MNIEQLRADIDKLDNEIVKLIGERFRLAEAIGKVKENVGSPVLDSDRELTVMKRVKEIGQQAGLKESEIMSIYHEVITAARRRQESLTVAFQGESGAYSEEAAFRYFGATVRVKACETFDAVFKAVNDDAAKYGMLPIENSLEGSIARSYDLLLDSTLSVSGEVKLKIEHQLISNPGVSLDNVKRIYSHPQALGQCQGFLKKLAFELIPTYDTAGSVKMIKEMEINDGAAIASTRAADIYGMNILARDIQDNANNFTRFFILSQSGVPSTGRDKTSVVFAVKHQPGALYEFLKVLADEHINLTKIESRPTRQKAWEYNFYLDFEGHHSEPGTQKALAKLDEISLFVKILGSYPKAD